MSEDLNLSCKSVQHRLATQWGYVKSNEWVGLTDEEIYDYANKFLYQHGSNYGIKSFGKAIEAKLKEKNNNETQD